MRAALAGQLLPLRGRQPVLAAALASVRLPHLAPHRVHGNAKFLGHFPRAAVTDLHQLDHLLPKSLRVRLQIGLLAHRLWHPEAPARPLVAAT